MHTDPKSPNIRKRLWWLAIACYILVLPYTILAFDLLEQQLSLPIARKIPVIIIITMALVYFYQQRSKLHLAQFLIPSTIIFVGVILLERNTIKYIHIPEYMFLSWLLFKTHQQSYANVTRYLSIFICASLLGVVDEVHHGMHPERYYGWKDMLINASGSLIGVLLLNVQRPIKTTKLLLKKTIYTYGNSLLLFLINLSIAVVSCIYLFRVQTTGSFEIAYPMWLTLANIMAISSGILFAIFKYKKTQIEQHFSQLLYQPLLLITLVHCIIYLALLIKLPFK